MSLNLKIITAAVIALSSRSAAECNSNARVDDFCGSFDVKNGLLTQCSPPTNVDKCVDVYLCCWDNEGEVVTGLDPDLFKGLTKLERIDVSGNAITDFAVGQFKDAPSTKDITLGTNPVPILRNGVLQGLSKLETFSMDSNKALTTVEADVFQDTPGVTRISIAWADNLKTLPVDLLKGLNKLDTVNYFWSHLTSLPAGAFKDLPLLKTIGLGRNNITSLVSGTFSNLPIVDKIEVYENNIATIAADAFVDVPKLRSLEMRENKFTELDEKVFSSMPNLKKLVLDFNKITAFPVNLFSNNPKMEEIIAGSTDLLKLEKGVFDNLPNLEALYLSNGKLAEIDAGTFDKNTEAKTLVFFQNNVAKFADDLFKFNTKLERLDLDQNPGADGCSPAAPLGDNKAAFEVVDPKICVADLADLEDGFAEGMEYKKYAHYKVIDGNNDKQVDISELDGKSLNERWHRCAVECAQQNDDNGTCAIFELVNDKSLCNLSYAEGFDGLTVKDDPNGVIGYITNWCKDCQPLEQ